MRFFTVLSVSALSLLAFAPAVFAQGFNDDGVIVNDSGNTDVQYVDCSQVQAAVQAQYGDANAIGDENVAAVASEQGITQNQVNACLGNVGGNPDGNNPPEEETTGGKTTRGETTGEDITDERTGEETTVVDGEMVIMPKTLAGKQLPETGGPSFAGIVLSSGCALLGVGLLLNRILR
ncbi:MAG: hypothetical protein WKF95_10525 [Rubrobacter sp.]